MASEITLTAALAFSKGGVSVDLSKVAAAFDVAGQRYIKNTQQIGTSEEAIGIGELASLGYAIFVNRDPTNYLEIRSATGSSNDIIKLKAGEAALFRFGSDISAPYAVANTAACYLEYLIVEN